MEDPRVDAYIDALPGWQQDVCREVRALVHAADPEVTETIKRTTRPYFVLQGNICALLAAKDHVNVFLYDGAIVPDPEGIITGGHGNSTARTVAIRQGEPINAPALTAMFRQIIANNRAGGWRKLKKSLSTERTSARRVRSRDRGMSGSIAWRDGSNREDRGVPGRAAQHHRRRDPPGRAPAPQPKLVLLGWRTLLRLDHAGPGEVRDLQPGPARRAAR
jgi:hypothetical protein